MGGWRDVKERWIQRDIPDFRKLLHHSLESVSAKKAFLKENSWESGKGESQKRKKSWEIRRGKRKMHKLNV